MSAKGRGRGKILNNDNNNYIRNNQLRSQSVVPELENKSTIKETQDPVVGTASNTVFDNSRSRSLDTRAQASAINTNFSYINTENNKFCIRPDSGNTVANRQTELIANFYDIDIDFTKSACHYDAEIDFIFQKKDGTSGKNEAKKEFKR